MFLEGSQWAEQTWRRKVSKHEEWHSMKNGIEAEKWEIQKGMLRKCRFHGGS